MAAIRKHEHIGYVHVLFHCTAVVQMQCSAVSMCTVILVTKYTERSNVVSRLHTYCVFGKSQVRDLVYSEFY
jgi:hypothetical protein